VNSRIFTGSIWHRRERPVIHEFRYPVFAFAVDLDELEELDRSFRWFGYNRFSLLSLHDADYLEGPGSMRERAMRLLRRNGIEDGIERIVLVTVPRLVFKVFNPVSFYYCLGAEDRPAGFIAEVNNTFHERHVYLLRPPEGGAWSWPVDARHAKEFHVSPFNDRAGEYAFHFEPLLGSLDIRIDLWRKGERVMKTLWAGAERPLTTRAVARTLAERPFSALLAMPRITWEAARLFWGKALAVYRKPYAAHPHTLIAKGPTRLERAGARAMDALFRRIERGRLRVVLPDGEERLYGDGNPIGAPSMRIASYAFFRKLLVGGAVGFGEAWTEEVWDSEDPAGVLRVLADNHDALRGGGRRMSRLTRPARRLLHALRDNTRLGSRRNIRAHYDYGNEFFSTFLDPRMMYSCGIYERDSSTLADAQAVKIERILEKLRLRPEHRLLEIGSGWGGFAVEAARRTGCRVTSITLSKEQLRIARERAEREGVADRVFFEYRDYRDVEGTFDRIVSLEMLEAVGHRRLGTYFAACDRILAPGGRAVLQVITIPDQRYDEYRRNPDWIQKYIFPGGMLPSLDAMSRAMTRRSRLIVEHLENIGPDYAPTLRDWREAFERSRDRLLELGYPERIQRMWRYYFAYCEAGFAARILNDLQLVLVRPGRQDAEGERQPKR
jgi:cyclopropane-fatty-acyl-phospholipid synthase